MTENLSSTPFASAGDYSTPVPFTAIESPSENRSEEMLAKRYTNRWTKKQEEVVFEFTRDPALLHQYYRIYEQEFKTTYKTEGYRVVENDYDRNGHILVARRGNFCVGGARISVKTPRQPHLLPLETDGFKLEDHFPYLKQKQIRYGQVGRLVLLPEFRGGEVTRELQRHITRKAIALNLEMFFAAAPLLNARVYKQNCIAIGFKDVKIHMSLDLPKYEEIKQYLVSGTIDKSLIGDQSDLVAEAELLCHEKV